MKNLRFKNSTVWAIAFLIASGIIGLLLLNVRLVPTRAAVTAPPRMGAAVLASRLDEVAFKDTLLRYGYRVLTPENDMKMRFTQPTQTTWDFEAADTIVQFAQDHSMEVHGHTLVWHKNPPEWLTSTNFTAAQLSAILKNRIDTMMNRYKGKVKEWDVANEVLNDPPLTGLRDSVWNKIGTNYVDLAFQWARAADPDATLYYNDYGIEGAGAKSDAAFNMIKSMKERGIPIDGVGFQMHKSITKYHTEAELTQNIARYKEIGVEVSITEMDVKTDRNPPTTADLVAQANVYRIAATACRESGNCPNFITWGLTDKYTWLEPDEPLPFTASYTPKPAYEALKEVLGLTVTPVLSATPTGPACSQKPGDANHDGQITLADFAAWRTAFLN